MKQLTSSVFSAIALLAFAIPAGAAGSQSAGPRPIDTPIGGSSPIENGGGLRAGRSTTAGAISVPVHDSRTISVFGATAAWAVDANIVDVAASNGVVTLFGRAAGRTRVVVISITGQSSLDVEVTARAATAPQAAAKNATGGTAEVRYSSAAHEVQSSVAVIREEKDRRTEVSLRTLHYAQKTPGDRAATSIASASYRIFTHGRELTLLDRDVDHSPLTLTNTPLRGVHYLDDHWRVHAGYTAYAAYRSFLIPVERQLVAGAGYAFRTSARSTLTPSFFSYRGQGTVASLLYDYRDGERLGIRTELGYSNGLGAAAQLAYDDGPDRVRADVRYRPEGFAITAGTTRGLLGDASWSHAYGRGSNFSLVASASDFANTRVLAGSADVDQRINDVLSLTGGISAGKFGDTSSVTVPAGIRLDFAHGGIGALYRYARSSTNRGGNGFRLTGRASLGRLYMSAYADRQENAPTLELIFAERPDLALALEELGITATSPADVARALREQQALIDLGFIEGVTVDLAPVRTQLGFELAWLGASASRQQFRARLLHNILETVGSESSTTIATLTYARRLTASSDVFASWSYWRTERAGAPAHAEPFVELGIRQSFNGLPSFLGGSGTISGIVFGDEDLDGRSDSTSVSAELELDGTTRRRTNPDGTFAFTGVTRGTHRLVARVPERPEAYFTTPARIEVETGEKVAFGVATTAARLQGRVLSDAKEGIAGVRLQLARGSQQLNAVTDSSGAFVFSSAPGEWQLTLLTDSVPTGYSLSNIAPKTVILDRATPQRSVYTLRALRSVSGSGATPLANINVKPLAKSIQADAEGRFTLRSLDPGELTFVAGGVEQHVTIPTGPASIAVDLTPANASVAAVASAAPVVRTVTVGERRDVMHGYVVQIGAYRVRANAVDTAARARVAGVEAVIDDGGNLTLVRSTVYTSRAAASAAAEALKLAGLDAVITSRN